MRKQTTAARIAGTLNLVAERGGLLAGTTGRYHARSQGVNRLGREVVMLDWSGEDRDAWLGWARGVLRRVPGFSVRRQSVNGNGDQALRVSVARERRA
jgi:hypothetical protein